jgi:hypothetical protein
MDLLICKGTCIIDLQILGIHVLHFCNAAADWSSKTNWVLSCQAKKWWLLASLIDLGFMENGEDGKPLAIAKMNLNGNVC